MTAIQDENVRDGSNAPIDQRRLNGRSHDDYSQLWRQFDRQEGGNDARLGLTKRRPRSAWLADPSIRADRARQVELGPGYVTTADASRAAYPWQPVASPCGVALDRCCREADYFCLGIGKRR
jgi:hypothetical protein